eukprot:COSAG01_NODE_8415_length_2790_cov_28.153475_3_plen_65_part_00
MAAMLLAAKKLDRTKLIQAAGRPHTPHAQLPSLLAAAALRIRRESHSRVFIVGRIRLYAVTCQT